MQPLPEEDPLKPLLDSLEGRSRARPPADMLGRIESALAPTPVRRLPTRWVRAASAAAAALLLLNGWILYEAISSDALRSGEASIELLDDYNLYTE